jgi:hypothetical protein
MGACFNNGRGATWKNGRSLTLFDICCCGAIGYNPHEKIVRLIDQPELLPPEVSKENFSEKASRTKPIKRKFKKIPNNLSQEDPDYYPPEVIYL